MKNKTPFIIQPFPETLTRQFQKINRGLNINTKVEIHDPDNHDGMITQLEPDILVCEVKRTLGSITTNKASGGDGIPVELFKS